MVATIRANDTRANEPLTLPRSGRTPSTHLPLMKPRSDHGTSNGKSRPMVLKILLLLVLLPALVLGQGKVDVSILGTKPIDEIWVTDPNGRPLTGTNLVAQIVYGPNAMSLTNQLGGPMPFRGLETQFPGTWNPPPGTRIRTLNGYTTGQTVWMQVWVWDSLGIQSLQEAQSSEVGWVGCRDLLVGASAAFSYRVGDLGNPSTLFMNNFAGFSVREFPAYPPYLAEAMVGGRWLGSIVATENTREVPINFLMQPNLGLPAGLTGNEPVGRIVRSIGTGNPLSLVRYDENPSLSPSVVGIRGSLAITELATEQSLVETEHAFLEGTVSNAVLRLKRPMLGRAELSMRYPLQETTSGGCPLPRKFVIDLRHVGTSVRMALAVTNGNSALRIRVPTGRRCRLFRSTDLIQWEPLDTYYVGFFDCLNPSWRSCGAYPDLDGVERVVDLEVPPERWGSPSLRQATFLRLDVGQ